VGELQGGRTIRNGTRALKVSRRPIKERGKKGRGKSSLGGISGEVPNRRTSERGSASFAGFEAGRERGH